MGACATRTPWGPCSPPFRNPDATFVDDTIFYLNDTTDKPRTDDTDKRHIEDTNQIPNELDPLFPTNITILQFMGAIHRSKIDCFSGRENRK